MEATKIRFADLAKWLTEPKQLAIPLDHLLSEENSAERRNLTDPRCAVAVGQVELGLRFGSSPERRSPYGDAVYSGAADSGGLVVSIIQSINQDFGAASIGGETLRLLIPGRLLKPGASSFGTSETHPS